jgi:hypothetical protein
MQDLTKSRRLRIPIAAMAAWGLGLWATEPSAYIECICLTCCKFSAVSPVVDPPA